MGRRRSPRRPALPRQHMHAQPAWPSLGRPGALAALPSMGRMMMMSSTRTGSARMMTMQRWQGRSAGQPSTGLSAIADATVMSQMEVCMTPCPLHAAQVKDEVVMLWAQHAHATASWKCVLPCCHLAIIMLLVEPIHSGYCPFSCRPGVGNLGQQQL